MRRSADLVQRVLLVVLGSTVGITAGYATASPAAGFFKVLQRWWLPAFVGAVLLTIAVEVWRHLGVRAPAGSRWEAGGPPFPGLEAFTEEDTVIFFGRESESEALFDRLHPILSARVNRFVTVVGPSGVGKSSLVQAGLVPALRRRRRSPWHIVGPIVPGGAPIRALADALEWDGDMAAFTAADALATVRGGAGNILLVVDQAEELLTLAGSRERDELLAQLDAALRDDARLWIVAVLRSEFLTGFLTTRFAHLFADPVTLGALSRTALAEVVEKPATLAGIAFDPPSLVQTIVDDTEGGDALPLLAYTLQTLYVERSSDGRITADDYRKVGGVAGTLTRRADKVTEELRAGGLAESAVLGTLLSLVTVTDGEPTRRRVRRAALSPEQREVADAFVTARLLTSDADGGDAALQVAHEALFRQWPPLAYAISQRRDDLRHRADLERWAADWDRSGRREPFLLRAERLALAERWATAQENLAVELPLVAAFLDHSRQAQRTEREGLSRSLAQQALSGLADDPEYALLLLIAALEECAETPEARRALIEALTLPHVVFVLRGHSARLECVGWSPDGAVLATGSADRTVRLWDVASGTELRVLDGHRAAILGMAWSPDGGRLASVSLDGTVRIWNARDGEVIRVLDMPGVETLAWSPDGSRLATTSRVDAARVWDAGTGAELLALTDEGVPVSGTGLAWSPDGDRLAVATHDRTVRIMDGRTGVMRTAIGRPGERGSRLAWSPDGSRLAGHVLPSTLRLWDPDAGVELFDLSGHQDSIRGLAWSSDGSRLASSSLDRTARLWDARTGVETHRLSGHGGEVTAVAWSPDGGLLASASADRTTRIWTTRAAREVFAFSGHTDNIIEIAWSPDGRQIATASYDHTAIVWNAGTGDAARGLRGHTAFVGSVTWSADGSRLSTSSYDGTARIWDARTGAELHVLLGHHGIVAGTAWSPDGSRLASTSEDGAVYVWDAHTGERLRELAAHELAVWDVDWSPDGRRLVTVSNDGAVIIWDAGAGDRLGALPGHDSAVWDVNWSPDGTRLATSSSDGTARVWDAGTGARLCELTGHGSTVWRVAWSPDGRRLATASADRTARVWDAGLGSELLFLGVHSERVECVAWSPGGDRVTTASHDGMIRIWDVATEAADSLAEARRRVHRRLSAAERRTLLLPARDDEAFPE